MSCTIYVKTLTGRTIPVDVDSEELKNMTVEELKRRLDRLDPQSKYYRLIYAGRELEDHKTLGDCCITHESTVHKVIRLSGGGGPPKDGVIPRTKSMEILAIMQQSESNGRCCIL